MEEGGVGGGADAIGGGTTTLTGTADTSTTGGGGEDDFGTGAGAAEEACGIPALTRATKERNPMRIAEYFIISSF